MSCPESEVAPSSLPTTSEENNPSWFSQHYFTAEIFDCSYAFRILKMDGQTLIYIGNEENQVMDEMAVALPVKSGNDIMSTTVLGPLIGCGSEDAAKRLSKRLKRQIYLSCNVPMDKSIHSALEKRLVEEIKSFPEYFS